MTYDFAGYATRNDLKCGDGRTIRRNAFKDCDGAEVPLIWNHDHSTQDAVLGHALLENRDDGVYAYCTLNDTPAGQTAKEIVKHGDVCSLSIYANKLKQIGSDVVHGTIRELSLVLAGANPGAYIDFVMAHGDDEEDGLYANWDTTGITLSHSFTEDEEPEEEKEPTFEPDNEEEELKHMDTENKSVQDIIDSMTPEQQDVMYALIAEAQDENGGDEGMKHNVFEGDTPNNSLMHAEMWNGIIADAPRFGSMRESYLAHASEYEWDPSYDVLFPEPHNLNNPPEFIRDDDSWVGKFMTAVKHTPFSRVKSQFADISMDEARARGYIKGHMKQNIAFATLRRVTEPTTVYIKMRIDRDDKLDITDFDVVAWQKTEMRRNLDRELAQAMLIGDGRDVSSEDKINEQNIRPILTDDDLFTIKYTVTEGRDYRITDDSYSENDSICKGVIRGARRARKDYKGSGNPYFFTTEDVLNDLLDIEDQNGRVIYETVEKLASAMRCKGIITVPEMERLEDVYGIIVNPADYNTGADKGGAINMFDDFDIDYNQMKYLMETRCSGALVRPYSAIVLKKDDSIRPAPVPQETQEPSGT